MTTKVCYVCQPLGVALSQAIDKLNGDGPAPAAITIGDTVYVFVDRKHLPTTILPHEAKHAEQKDRYRPAWLRWWPTLQNQIATGRFIAAYVAEHRKHGYHGNRFEIEARAAAGER